MRRAHSLTRAAFVVLAACAACARPAPAQEGAPVPASMVQGKRLTVADANAIIDAPSVTWKWYRATVSGSIPGAENARYEAFTCKNSMSENDLPYLLMVAYAKMPPLTPDLVDRFVRGVQRSSKGTKLIFANPYTEPSELPFPGSYRFKYELLNAAVTGTMFGYIGSRNGLYMTQCVTLDAQEPPAFTRFTRTLRVAELGAAPVPDSHRSEAVSLGAGALLGIVLAVEAARKRRKRRKRAVAPRGRVAPVRLRGYGR